VLQTAGFDRANASDGADFKTSANGYSNRVKCGEMFTFAIPVGHNSEFAPLEPEIKVFTSL